MAELSGSESRPASGGKTAVGRLFVLELNADRIIKKTRSHGTIANVSVGPKCHNPPRTYRFHPSRVG